MNLLLGVLSIQIIEKAKEETKEMDIVFCGLPRAFDGFSAWNHNHGRLQCSRNTDGIAFYFFARKPGFLFAAQLVGLYYLNVVMLGNLYYPVTILGHHFEIAQQSFALLALISIWLYHGEQRSIASGSKYFCYAFYPVHFLILFVIWQWRIR